jgi:hypothetical protein
MGKKTRQKKSEQTLQMPEPEAADPVQAHLSSDFPVMVPLSVAEIRRLFLCLVGKPPLSFAYHLGWSYWRRAHQALARLSHYKRRSAFTSYRCRMPLCFTHGEECGAPFSFNTIVSLTNR